MGVGSYALQSICLEGYTHGLDIHETAPEVIVTDHQVMGCSQLTSFRRVEGR